jgi:hypothetical protein
VRRAQKPIDVEPSRFAAPPGVRRTRVTLDTFRSVIPAILSAAGGVGSAGERGVRRVPLGRDRVLPLVPSQPRLATTNEVCELTAERICPASPPAPPHMGSPGRPLRSVRRRARAGTPCGGWRPMCVGAWRCRQRDAPRWPRGELCPWRCPFWGAMGMRRAHDAG